LVSDRGGVVRERAMTTPSMRVPSNESTRSISGEPKLEETRDVLSFNPAQSTGQRLLYVAEVLPKSGLLYSEKASFSEVLCKPKILPIKSMAVLAAEKRAKEEMRAASRAAGSGGPGDDEDDEDDRGFG